MSEPVDADQVARKDFSVSFRGFDQHEVRAFLAKVAGELGAWEERERSLRARIVDLERPAPVAELDEATIEAALGQTATRIIQAAREAAAEIRARAESESAQKLEEADAILAKANEEAAAATDALRAEFEESLAAKREETDLELASILDEARTTAAAMTLDATETRDRTLRELAARRAELLGELEHLQQARDRLRDAYESVRRSLDAALDGVAAAGEQARAAVERANDADARVDVDVAVERDVVVEDVEPAAAAEPERDPAPEPEPTGETAQREPEEERRSSALRLVRPSLDVERGTPTAPASDDPYEGVRIIRPGPEAEPEPAPEVDVDVEVDTVEAATAAQTDTASAVVDVDDVEEVEDVDEVAARLEEPEVAVVDEREVAGVDETDAAPVEDLFARLRADRAEKVARAEAVLAATDPSPSEPERESTLEDDDADELSPDLALLAGRDVAVADAERAVLRSLKRALADEQNEVLDALRRLKGKPTLDALLPDVAVHDARYDAVLSSGASRAAGAGGELAGGGGGNAAKVTADIGRSVASDLRTRVDRSIDDAAGDVDTLAEAISATYREWKTARAERLAREVITAAYAAGTYTAADGELRWVVDPAEGGCPDCEDNVLAGPTPKGTAFPTGQLHPPAHAGCRCALVPVS